MIGFCEKNVKGILLCLAIALPAWVIGRHIPVMGGPVAGILLGLLAAFIPRSEVFSPGIRYMSKKGLQGAIVLLGFEMNFFYVLKTGRDSFFVIVTTIAAALLTAWLLSRVLRLHDKSSVLIGVGTAICGGSAIAAAAPCINASDEEIAQSISTIFLFNISAAFLVPALGRWMGMTDFGFGVWAGTAVNDASSVVAAATAWSSAAGNDTALALATIVKLTRTLAIIPITLFLAFYTARKQRVATYQYDWKRVFPWFVLLFLLAAVLSTLLRFPHSITAPLGQTGKFLITTAMAGIGLNTNIVKLVRNSARSITLGLGCWIAVATVSIVVQRATGLW